MRKVKVKIEMCTYYKGFRKVTSIYTPNIDEKYTSEVRSIFWAMPKDSKKDIIKKSKKMIKDTLFKRNIIDATKSMSNL